MHRLHKADVRQYRFLVRGEGVGHQRRRADGILDGIEQRQPGEDANRQLLLRRGEGLPGGDIVGQRHLLRQPEVAGQPIPDLQILIIFNLVPVDGADAR